MARSNADYNVRPPEKPRREVYSRRGFCLAAGASGYLRGLAARTLFKKYEILGDAAF
jgi:hypothetical protein